MPQEKLDPSFFQSGDVVGLSKKLIGCKLSTFIDNRLTSGIITETEAYAGQGDKACHAHLGRFTKRTSVMYEPGGIAYIYLCYGIHHLFNIVTNTKGHADAVLIRAIEPIDGIDIMLERRQKTTLDKSLTSGPGNLTKALGLTKTHNTQSVSSDNIWLEPATTEIKNIVETTRIGIDYAEEDALLPWRFYHADSKFVSVR
jgi:DNA-3-methyladenine glycosylase